MKKLHLLFSHSLTPQQIADAKKSLGIEKCVPLPNELQSLWSNIPPGLTSLHHYLEPLKSYLCKEAQTGDVVLIQGDFGGCYAIVNFVKSLGLTAVYATTQRDAAETHRGDRVYKKSIFRHIRFRTY